MNYNYEECDAESVDEVETETEYSEEDDYEETIESEE